MNNKGTTKEQQRNKARTLVEQKRKTKDHQSNNAGTVR